MATALRTLSDTLTQPNPILVEAGRKISKSNTTNRKWPLVRDVVPWEDFNWHTLRRISSSQFQHTLNRTLPLRQISAPDPAQLQISDEDSLTSAIALSNQSIVLEALSKTSNTLISQNVQMVKGGQAFLFFGSLRDKPDWAGTNDEERRIIGQLPRNILPGDTKMSWKWKSTQLERCRLMKRDGYLYPAKPLWPVRQLIYYCIASYARYGYIITDEELVVVHVGPTQNRALEMQRTRIVGRSCTIHFHSKGKFWDDGRTNNQSRAMDSPHSRRKQWTP